jgi:hypothetical protein
LLKGPPERQKESDLLLIDEHFVVSNGTIKSDLLAPPTPSPYLNIPVPYELRFTMHASGLQNCDNPIYWTDNSQPTECFNFVDFYGFDPGSARFPSNPGWRLDVFAERNCQGTVRGSVTPADGDQCVVLPDVAVLSGSILPTWNWI